MKKALAMMLALSAGCARRLRRRGRGASLPHPGADRPPVQEYAESAPITVTRHARGAVRGRSRRSPTCPRAPATTSTSYELEADGAKSRARWRRVFSLEDGAWVHRTDGHCL